MPHKICIFADETRASAASASAWRASVSMTRKTSTSATTSPASSAVSSPQAAASRAVTSSTTSATASRPSGRKASSRRLCQTVNHIQHGAIVRHFMVADFARRDVIKEFLGTFYLGQFHPLQLHRVHTTLCFRNKEDVLHTHISLKAMAQSGA